MPETGKETALRPRRHAAVTSETMKRLLFGLILAMLPLTASAQIRDALLTPDGTLYAIEVEYASDHPDVAIDSSSYFVLSTRNGENATRELVPATRSKGSHSDPAIAYDSGSGLLFLFWLHHPGLLYNELLVATRNGEGVWSDPTPLGNPWNFRENLRIGVTRKIDDPESGVATPGISVHAAWWEFDSMTGVESAQYAMLAIDNGIVIDVQNLALTDFVDGSMTPGPEDLATAVLKQPLLSVPTQGDSVLVTFGDLGTRSLHQVRVRPTRVKDDVRIRIPIGRKERQMPAPRFASAAHGRVEAVYGDSGRLALYVRGAETVHCVVMRNGEWSDVRTIALNAGIAADTAVAAIGRLVAEH